MKKILPIQLAVTLMVMLVPLTLSAVNTIFHTVNYSSSGMTVGTDTLGGVTYTTVNYGDLYNGGEPGMPSLPIDYLKFSVPYNATNFSVTATLSNNTTLYSNRLVYPCQPPRLMSDTTPVVITLPDSAVYFANSFYPSQAAWVVDEGFLAGENHIVTVAVMPIAYKHKSATDQLRISGTVRLSLHYDLSDSLAMYPIVRNDTALRNEGYRLTQSMVVNPSNVLAFAPDMVMDTMMVINPNSGDGLNVLPPEPNDPIDPNPGVLEQASYPYLIVTTPELKNSLRRLAALKRQKGYSVAIVTMDDVIADSYAMTGDIAKSRNGTYEIAYNDSAGKLRQYLKYCYRMLNTKYLLLAGEVPFRYAYTFGPYLNVIDSIPSDLYFNDLHGFWSSNNRKVNIDINPELYVGRLPANNDRQISNYTEKLLRYEFNPGDGDYSYLKRIIYSESLDFQDYNSINYVDAFYRQIFPHNRILQERKNAHFPSGKDLVDTINTIRFGYISLHNHAGPTGHITYGFSNIKQDYCDSPHLYLWAIDTINIIYNNQCYQESLTGNGMNNLDNKRYPSICYSEGCSSMPFDVIPEYNTPINCGQSFTLGKDYGGPAFLGNTRDNTIGSVIPLERLFAEELSKGNCVIGKTEAICKLGLSYDPNACMTHNLLGDPEFDIWTDEPQQYTGINVIRSDNQISVSGINTDSTIVACYGNDGVVKKTMASSSVTFTSISPNCTVMLYKHNYIPYIAPLFLQNESFNQSQYMIASDVTAGSAIDSNRTPGEVTVKNGIEYEIEASGTVTLQDGFKVEKGATFAVYPSCF